jgi:HlyD family secretion protein
MKGRLFMPGQTSSVLSKLRPLLFGLGALAAGLTLWQARSLTEKSAAGIEAAGARVAPTSSLITAEGRVVTYPGAEAQISTDLPGTLRRVLVREKQVVRRGELLAEIEADDLRAALAEAQARVHEIHADLRLFEIEVDRHQRLLDAKVGTPQALDRARRDVEAAQARLVTAAASIRRLEAELAKTRIESPLDGVVVARTADRGETVAVGEELFTVADLSRLRVEAEVDEFDAGRVELGTQVAVSAEGYEQSWPGTVEEIPDAVVLRGLEPRDPGRPSDTRVLKVKVALTAPTPLKLGQRVEVRIGG